jgi:hypothetical protein
MNSKDNFNTYHNFNLKTRVDARIQLKTKFEEKHCEYCNSCSVAETIS